MKIMRVSNVIAIPFSESKKTGWLVEYGFVYSIGGEWVSLVENHQMKNALGQWR